MREPKKASRMVNIGLERDREGKRRRVELQLSHRGQNSGRMHEHKAPQLCMDNISLSSCAFTVAFAHKVSVTVPTTGFPSVISAAHDPFMHVTSTRVHMQAFVTPNNVTTATQMVHSAPWLSQRYLENL